MINFFSILLKKIGKNAKVFQKFQKVVLKYRKTAKLQNIILNYSGSLRIKELILNLLCYLFSIYYENMLMQ